MLKILFIHKKTLQQGIICLDNFNCFNEHFWNIYFKINKNPSLRNIFPNKTKFQRIEWRASAEIAHRLCVAENGGDKNSGLSSHGRFLAPQCGSSQ